MRTRLRQPKLDPANISLQQHQFYLSELVVTILRRWRLNERSSIHRSSADTTAEARRMTVLHSVYWRYAWN